MGRTEGNASTKNIARPTFEMRPEAGPKWLKYSNFKITGGSP
jgi:hypothetical protein